MADIVSPEKRSQMMSGIRGKNTKPELIVRKQLFARGYRYRLHAKGLPGKPDIIFPALKTAIFIHGCFWHLHKCHLFKWPKSNPKFWQGKIEGNRKHDLNKQKELKKAGWRVLVIRECAMKGKTRIPLEDLTDRVVDWLESEAPAGDIAGGRIRSAK